jgi:AraC-like DNA-binding protein
MGFETYLPSDVLKPWIRSFAISENPKETIYRVLPDTGLVMGFQFRGRLSIVNGKDEVSLAASGISGMQDHARFFKNSPNTGTLLVFFREGGASRFFKQPIHELFRESASMDNFMLRSELMIFEEQLCEAKTPLKRIEAVESFLISRMGQGKPDYLVMNAIALIYKSKGAIRVRELMDQLHISQSPLEKRFRQVVGASPKKFASIVRFKNTVRSYDPNKSLTEVGYENGFYDQAHFIKEFKSFTGETPDAFFSQKQ